MTQKPVLRYNNLSGHVAMSARTNNFYQEIARKEQRIMLEHECGMGQKVSANNPILATRTAREKPKHIDFDTPPPIHKDRYAKWNYPEADIGLISQLPSQKEKFERIRQKEMDYQQCLSLHNSKLKNNTGNEDIESSSSSSSSSASSNGQTVPETSSICSSSSSRLHKNINSHGEETNQTNGKGIGTRGTESTAIKTNDSMNISSSSSLINNKSNTIPSSSATTTTKTKPLKNKSNTSPRSPVDCYSQNVTDFKKTLNSNPDMMSLYRAKRAAAFIEKQSVKNQTPYTHDDEIHNRHHHNTMIGGGVDSSSSSSSRLPKNPDLHSLLHELKATEEKIHNLQLKVGLQSKTKGYERPTTHTSMRRTSFS